MDPIILGIDGTLLEKHSTVKGSGLRYLGSPIKLQAGYSLRSYFRMIERKEMFQSLNVFLPGFLERYRCCPSGGCCRADFDTLEFHKTVEMVGFPGKPRLEIYTSLHPAKNRQACAITALPLETIMDMPLCLGKLKHIVFGDKVDVFEFETAFGLFEFIDGVAWELSFQDPSAECALRR